MMQHRERQKVSEAANATHLSGELETLLATSAAARQQMMSAVAAATQRVFAGHREAFIQSLSALNQAVYHEAQKIPYAPRDWWRDPHDCIVTWSLSIIVHEENARLRGAGAEPLLPEWLVTAALVHDRGYGILAKQSDASSADYHGHAGAHWENVDTRLLHSMLSRRFAEALLCGGGWQTLLPGVRLPKMEPITGVNIGAEQELFLSVVEKHDHPLIAKLEELPAIGRHHFDADSLYSISLSSFVKDWLSYLSDSGKIERLRSMGLIDGATLSAKTLLGIRLARYYSDSAALPAGWDSASAALRPELAHGNEGERCIEPHSPTARMLTDESFVALLACCKALDAAKSIEQFTGWFENSIVDQFERLHARALLLTGPE